MEVDSGFPFSSKTTTPGQKTSASFLYNGTRQMFQDAGFTYDRPKGKNNDVMSTTVAAA